MPMRVKQRLDLIDKLSRELQARYSYGDIDIFLSSVGITIPSNYQGPNSKWSYSKEALRDADEASLLRVAEELDVSLPSMASIKMPAPVSWADITAFRLFVSHLAVHKDRALRMKEALDPHKISCFVAHEDIVPTLAWQEQIERALFSMDAMLAIHTTGFSGSVWTQQEIGVAIGRGVKIISLKMDEDPKGFIGKNQAILRRGRNANGVAEEIVSILINDAQTKTRMAEVMALDRQLELDDIPF